MEDISKKEADGTLETPNAEEELDCKTDGESNGASSMKTETENLDGQSTPMIREDIEEIKEDNKDQLHKMNGIIEEIVKTFESHGLPKTNSANWNEVTIPENASCLTVSNLKSPESRITEDTGENKEDNDDLILEINRIIEEIVETAHQQGMSFKNSGNWNEVIIPEYSWFQVSNLEVSPESGADRMGNTPHIKEELDCKTVSKSNIPLSMQTETQNMDEASKPKIIEDCEKIMEDNNNQLCEISRIIEEIVKTVEHNELCMSNSANYNEVPIPQNSSQSLVGNLESPESRAISSEETSENQKEGTKQYFTMNNIKEDLNKTLKQQGLTITDFVLLKGDVSKNSSILTVHNLENPQVDLANDNGGSQEQFQFHQYKPKACMSAVAQDMQQIFQKHGMTLEKAAVSGLIQAGESPSSSLQPSLSDTEKSDEESVDFPKPPAKTQQKYKWYMIGEMVMEGENQLSGPSGTNPETSNALANQDQVVSSSESDTDE